MSSDQSELDQPCNIHTGAQQQPETTPATSAPTGEAQQRSGARAGATQPKKQPTVSSSVSGGKKPTQATTNTRHATKGSNQNEAKASKTNTAPKTKATRTSSVNSQSSQKNTRTQSVNSVSSQSSQKNTARTQSVNSVGSQSSQQVDEEDEDEDKEEEDWQGWDEEPESNQAVCLFCAHITPTASLWTHMKDTHKFDFYALKEKRELEFYDCIRLINFIRSRTQKGMSDQETIKAINTHPVWLTNDEFLKPVIEDDALLFELDDSDSDEDEQQHAFNNSKSNNKNQEQKHVASSSSSSSSASSSTTSSSSRKNKKLPPDPLMALEKTNVLLRGQLQDAHDRIHQMQQAMKRFIEDADEKFLGPAEKPINPHDEGYFENYSGRNIHEVMLKDQTRTLAYRSFILNNKELFAGKTVLDVGCGTGILCMFAAQAGAKQVIGVDAADIIDKAKIIVKTNKFDHIITFVKSKIEEAVLPVEKVDIIISEWMGYFLLFESMLPSVLFARDKWLVEGGLVLPNQATMFIAGARVAKRDAVESFWKDVYGFDMRTLVDEKEVQVSCDVDDVAATKVCTSSQIIKHLDILTCRNPDLEFTTAFELEAQKESLLDSLVVWFDVLFQHKSSAPIVLTTSPTGPTVPLTHWFQTVFYLHEHLSLHPGDVVVGSIEALRDKECDRSYDVKLTYGLKGKEVYVQEFTV